MIDYENLKQEIEEEYELTVRGEQQDKNRLYMLLSQYIRRTIEVTVMEGSRIKQDDLEDILQNTMLAIFEKGIYNYKKQGKSFAGYCCMIARNKAIDYANHKRRENISRIAMASDEDYSIEEWMDYLTGGQSEANSKTPENTLMDMELHLERIGMLKQLLHLIMNQKEKAYRTVGCCYTIILFQILHPRTKELSSPKWAFEELKEKPLLDSADRFLYEMNKRMKYGKLVWGSYFWDSMETEEAGTLICDLIFGERFKIKDLENWSIRFRNKLKEEICYDLC